MADLSTDHRKAFTTSIDMEPVKERLRNLPSFLPGQASEVYEFARLLSERLEGRKAPLGFNLVYDTLVGELAHNLKAFSDAPTENSLVAQPPQFYQTLRAWAPMICEAVAPKEFAGAFFALRRMM